MKLDVKPALVIGVTLLLGMVLGALAWSVLMHYRMDRLHGMMRPQGIQERLIESIGPMSDAQRQAVTEEIRRSSLRIDAAIDSGRASMDRMIDSMKVRLDSLLTPEQQARLRRSVGDRAHRRGGPFGGPGLPPREGGPRPGFDGRERPPEPPEH
jgi:hypothetical protein